MSGYVFKRLLHVLHSKVLIPFSNAVYRFLLSWLFHYIPNWENTSISMKNSIEVQQKVLGWSDIVFSEELFTDVVDLI